MNYNRRYQLVKNTFYSVLYQGTTIICGFILPRFILSAYGSEVNGLINSITQFLGVITLLDMGIGAVVQSALYKPIADNNFAQLSKIFVAANKYYRAIAIVLAGYVCLLLLFYPRFINTSLSQAHTVALILVIAINLFGQYYFGAVNSLVLSADQKVYLQYIIQLVTLILNTCVSIILIKMGCTIQLVKFVSSLIYFARPVFLNLYVKRNYSIDRKTKVESGVIEQKWNGIARHFCHYVLTGTDSIVLTVFSSLSNVSIYSVYNLIVSGVKSLVSSTTSGLQSLMGDMIARGEQEDLILFFSKIEWLIHSICIIVFGCTSVLLVPFINVYTADVHDANYCQPLFGFLIAWANALFCLRMPYDILIMSANHYKQTQNNYFVAMVANIAISIFTVKRWGLIGVSIGTLLAMIYQFFWMAWYDFRYILNRHLFPFLMQCLVDVSVAIIASLISVRVRMVHISYWGWVKHALIVFVIWTSISSAVNYLFCRDRIHDLICFVKKRLGLNLR